MTLFQLDSTQLDPTLLPAPTFPNMATFPQATQGDMHSSFSPFIIRTTLRRFVGQRVCDRTMVTSDLNLNLPGLPHYPGSRLHIKFMFSEMQFFSNDRNK